MAKEKRDIVKEAQIKLNDACKNYCTDPTNQEYKNSVNKCKLNYECVSTANTQGARIRSKAQWHEQGEKSTKYFLQLEKARAKKKCITSLKTSDDKIVTDQNKIVELTNQFYTDLYAKKIVFRPAKLDDFLQGVDVPKLSAIDRDLCEGKITFEECKSAIKGMRSDASPGLDGLSAAFYKVFFVKFEQLLVDCLNTAVETGHLSCSQRKGLTVLIPKKDLPRNELKNWRPLSLTNVDYKIVAKVIASRLKSVVPSIVNEDQCGYVKKRGAAQILRAIDDTMEFIDTNNMKGIMIGVDYEKAYDSISKEFMLKALEHFGFGASLLKWVEIMNTDGHNHILQNGWIVGNIKLERGIRQGCPLSPLLFIIACELLSCRIRQSADINGFKIPGQAK